MVSELHDSFCGLYPFQTCYVALKLMDWDFEPASEWLVV